MNLLTQPQKLFVIIIITGFIALFALSHFALHPLYDTSLLPPDAADQSRKFSDYFDKETLLIYVVLIFIANLIYRDTQKGIYCFMPGSFSRHLLCSAICICPKNYSILKSVTICGKANYRLHL